MAKPGAMPIKRSTRMRFASNLRTLRLQKGFSQEALAELSGLHRTYVGSVERGERNVSIDNMERLAHALGVEVIDLLGDSRRRT
jgi:transcriptional regulator with XRE-family HTH domain